MTFNSYRPEVHGHRGCRGLRPENTLPAFLHALVLGVDVLELDVVISADGQVVVSHEPWFNPSICFGPGSNLLTSFTTLVNLYELPYKAIRQYDCGQLRHPDFPEQVSTSAHKPLLRDVLASVEATARELGRSPVDYSIEIKSSPDGDNVFHPTPADFWPLVLTELVLAQIVPRTTLLSFDMRILRLVHQHQPYLPTCLLVEDDQPWLLSIQQLGFVPTTFGPDFHSVTFEAVRLLRASFPALRLVPWTVNEVQDFRRLCALEVDGITTDYPDRLLSFLSENRQGC